MKKKFSFILAFLMILTAIPLGSLKIFAEDEKNGNVIRTLEVGGNVWYGFYYESDEAAVAAGCVARVNNGTETPVYTLTLRVASAFAQNNGTVYLLCDIEDTGKTVYYTVNDSDGYDKDDEYIGTEKEKMSQESSFWFDNGARTFIFDGQGHTLSCTTNSVVTFKSVSKAHGMVYRNVKIYASTIGNQVALQMNNSVKSLLDNVTIISEQLSQVGAVVVQPGANVTFHDCTIRTETPEEVYKAAGKTGDSVTAGIRVNGDAGFKNLGAVVNIAGNTSISSAFGCAIVVYGTWKEDVPDDPATPENEYVAGNKQTHTVNIETTGTLSGGKRKATITSGAVNATINIYAGTILGGVEGHSVYQVDGHLNMYGGNITSDTGKGIVVTMRNGSTVRPTLNVMDGVISAKNVAIEATSAIVNIEKGSFSSTDGCALTAKASEVTILDGTFTVNDAAPAADDSKETVDSRSNYALHCSAGSTVNVYNGLFTTNYTTTVRVSDKGSTLNLYSGTFTNRYGLKNHPTLCSTNGITNIYDGMFSNGQFGVLWAYGEAEMNVYNGEFFFNENYSSATDPLNIAVVIMGRDTKQTVVRIYGGRYRQAEEATSPCVFLNNKLEEGDTNHCVVYGGHFENGSIPFTGMEYETGSRSFSLAPAMNDGAQVRLVPETDGIRFTSEVSDTIIDYIQGTLGGTILSYGTIITPFEYLQYAEDFTQSALDKARIPGVPSTALRYVDILATEAGGLRTDENGNILLSSALVGIRDGNLNCRFAARSYLVYKTVDGEEITLYSDFDHAANVRSLAEVAMRALADVRETADETYSTEVSSYFSTSDGITFAEVTGKAYSRYTVEQLAVLRAYIEKMEAIA